MGNFLSLLRMVARRALAHRVLVATVIIGVTFAAGLMSAVVMYSDAIRDLGLRHALRDEDPLKLDVHVTSSTQSAKPSEYEVRSEKTENLIEARAGAVVDDIVLAGRSATFFPTAPGEAVSAGDLRPRAHFQYVDGLDDHIRIVEGQEPGPAQLAAQGAGPVVEVFLGKAAADRLGLKVGQQFELHPYWRVVPPVRVTIAGLIEPEDPDERFWFGSVGRFDEDSTTWPTYAFFTTEETMIEILGSYLPDMDGSFETHVFVDPSAINSRNARQVEDGVVGLRVQLREQIPRTAVETSLDSVISQYRTRLFFTRLPLLALMAQVVAIVLYYLVMVSTMLVERQAGEIALLRSRGASSWQVLAIYAIEAFVVCGLAVIAGPLLIGLAIASLGPTPPFRELSDGGLLDVTFSKAAFGMAAIGAGFAFTAMLWPAFRAARHSVIDHKQQLARPQRQPAFLRYYLDLVVIAAAGLAFYQLRQQGSLVTDRLFGELSADPLLLISPTLFMFMIALAFLRLFPLALRLAAIPVRRLNGATFNLGLSRMVRSPLQYSRLILLLLLATAVGMFAAGFRATLERGYDDRSSYQAGAEGRVAGISTIATTPQALADRVAEAADAERGTAVARDEATFASGPFRTDSVDVLGVDASSFDDVAFWRGDFAGARLSSLLGRLPPGKEKQEEGVVAPVIPAEATLIGLWAQVPLQDQAYSLGVRLSSESGNDVEYRLIGSGAVVDGWRFYWEFLGRGIPGSSPRQPGENLTVDSVYIRLRGVAPPAGQKVVVLFDDLQWTVATGVPADWERGFASGTVVEDFEDLQRYEVIAGQVANGDPGAISREEVKGRSGRYAARLNFDRTRTGATLYGMSARSSAGALPVLVDKDFLSAFERSEGDELDVYLNRQYMRVRIVGTFELFPTFQPGPAEHLLVADLSSLLRASSRSPGIGERVTVSEVWLDGLPRDATLTKETLARGGIQAVSVINQSDVRAAQAKDPLIAASWEGILFISFASVLALTALGFGVYVALAAQARSLEFAILRTMGYSSRQILSLVTFEQCFVILGGVVVGTLLGFPLGRLMVDYLGVTETGADPVPPLLSQVSWSAAITVYALLGIVFIGTIAALATTYSRLAVHRALRIGEV